jgi:hypothetical protein
MHTIEEETIKVRAFEPEDEPCQWVYGSRKRRNRFRRTRFRSPEDRAEDRQSGRTFLTGVVLMIVGFIQCLLTPVGATTITFSGFLIDVPISHAPGILFMIFGYLLIVRVSRRSSKRDSPR